MKRSDMSHEQYALLFHVRRSIRYHDRRRTYFERLHHITSALTILLAGSVLFDLAKPGDSPGWMIILALISGFLSIFDMVVNYSSNATKHHDLKKRFGDLEIAIKTGNNEDATWKAHHKELLSIEKDEPPIYRALDLFCHNELLRADGFKQDEPNGAQFAKLSRYQWITRHIFHWADIKQ